MRGRTNSAKGCANEYMDKWIYPFFHIYTLDNHQIEYGLIYFPELLQLFFFRRHVSLQILSALQIEYGAYINVQNIYIYVYIVNLSLHHTHNQNTRRHWHVCVFRHAWLWFWTSFSAQSMCTLRHRNTTPDQRISKQIVRKYDLKNLRLLWTDIDIYIFIYIV